MKKIFGLLLLFVLVASIATAQTTGPGKAKWTIGPSVGLELPIGDYADIAGFGIGATARAQYGLQENLALTGDFGYTWHAKKNEISTYAFPLMFGAKYAVGKSFYVSGQLGLYFVTVSVPDLVIPGIGNVIYRCEQLRDEVRPRARRRLREGTVGSVFPVRGARYGYHEPGVDRRVQLPDGLVKHSVVPERHERDSFGSLSLFLGGAKAGGSRMAVTGGYSQGAALFRVCRYRPEVRSSCQHFLISIFRAGILDKVGTAEYIQSSFHSTSTWRFHSYESTARSRSDAWCAHDAFGRALARSEAAVGGRVRNGIVDRLHRRRWTHGHTIFRQVRFESSGSGAKAGFVFGPTGEVIFSKSYGIRTGFFIGTQTGTPIEWQNLFRYYFNIKGSDIKPYAHAGFSLIFITGGPYVAIPFGGGALFPIAKNLYIPADLTFGPIFGGGTTVFGVQIKGGIKYYFG